MQRTGMLRKVMLAGILSLTVASPAWADTFVSGHFRRDGTYVEPHYRSNPDGNFWNNWGTQGNVNPYTGQWGHGSIQVKPSQTTRGTHFLVNQIGRLRAIDSGGKQ